MEREKERRKWKMEKRRKEGTKQKDSYSLLSDLFGWSTEHTHFRIEQAAKGLLNKRILPVCRCAFFFFFHLQIMKHKWFRGRLKGICSVRLWRTTGKHTEKQHQGGVLPDLHLATSLSEFSKARNMKALTQETLQKCSPLLHQCHNTDKICCVGVQSSHWKKDGDTTVSQKDFSLILWAEGIQKLGKVWV